MFYIIQKFLYFLIPLLIIGLSLYFYFKYSNTYWQRQGIPCIPAKHFLFGNYSACFLFREDLAATFNKIYKAIKGSYVGTYGLGRAGITVKCPKLTKKILVDDFHIFTNRFNIKHDDFPSKLYNSISQLQGNEWHQLRQTLEASFTNIKVNHLTSTVAFLGLKFQESLIKSVEAGNNIVDTFDLLSQFISDVICATQFGIDIENNKNSANVLFCKIAKQLMTQTSLTMCQTSIIYCFPKLSKFLKIGSMKSVEEIIRKVTNDIIQEREIKKIYRNDLVQALIQLRNTGCIQDSNKDPITSITEESEKFMSSDEIMANLFKFFINGFMTTSSSISFILFEIAKNHKIQSQMHHEIIKTLNKYRQTWSYECLSEMKYIDQVIDEGLRKYPPAPVISRINSQDYRIHENVPEIKKNSKFLLLIYSIHHDENYYPNPEEFDPERFSHEAKINREPFTYLPYGLGPRGCLASKLGHMIIKIGLIAVLSKFKLFLNDPSETEIKYQMYGELSPKGECKLRIELYRN